MYASIGSGHTLSVENGRISVRLDSQGCKSCGLGCSTGDMIIAENMCNAVVGDKVHLSEDETFMITLNLIQFGLPLAGFLAGTLTVYLAYPSEIFSLLGGFLGIGLGVLVGRMAMAFASSRKAPVFIADRVL